MSHRGYGGAGVSFPLRRSATEGGGEWYSSFDSLFSARAEGLRFSATGIFKVSGGSACGSPSGRDVGGRRFALPPGQKSKDSATSGLPRTRRRAVVIPGRLFSNGKRVSSELWAARIIQLRDGLSNVLKRHAN